MLLNVYVDVMDTRCVSKPPLHSDLVTRTHVATDTIKTSLFHAVTCFETRKRVLDLIFSGRVRGQDVGLRNVTGILFDKVKCQNLYYIEKRRRRCDY